MAGKNQIRIKVSLERDGGGHSQGVLHLDNSERYEGLYREGEETQQGNGLGGYVLSKVFLIQGPCLCFALFDWFSTTEHKLLGLVSEFS